MGKKEKFIYLAGVEPLSLNTLRLLLRAKEQDSTCPIACEQVSVLRNYIELREILGD